MDEVWFAIPSASVERCRERLPAWRAMGYRVAVLQNRERGEIPADRVVWRDDYPGWAESVNMLCREVVPREAPVVVTGGDDMLPDSEADAQELLRLFRSRFPDGFGVMQPAGDTHMNAREYCGSPWFGRAWIQRAYQGNGPMHGSYRHNWADHELRWVAEALGALWMHEGATQRHEHFTRTGEAPPAFWEGEVSAHDRLDVERFMARLWQGFPGHTPAWGQGVDSAWWAERYDGTAHRYWAARYGNEWIGSDAATRLSAALALCERRGLRRVAVYGAGSETRAAGAALMSPPVEVVCLIDDDPRLAGSSLWGYPIESLDVATRREMDAVVLSSRSMNESLAARVEPLAARGIEIVSAQDALAAA
ncbi:MAG: hypothetical protein AAGK04_01235 [Planctomycetota bacterium]